jgi:alpha-beta hydrolase superfamily lysophospholipase
MKRRDEFAARITVPVLLLQSGDDYVVKKDASLAFYDRLKTTDKELEVYPDFYHEIFSETAREKAFARTAAWLLSKFEHVL